MSRLRFSTAGLVELAFDNFPDRLAVIDEFGQMTYRELRDAARNLAVNLQRRGIREGSSVAILARNSRAHLIPLIAAAYIGARPVIMNPFSSATQIGGIFSEYGAEFFFADAEYEDVADATPGVPAALFGLPADATTAHLRAEDMLAITGSVEELPARPTQQSTVIMSSGTHGIPKGVKMPEKNDIRSAASTFAYVPWQEGLRVQLTASMFHAWGWGNLLYCLSTASTMIMRRYFDAEEAVHDCINHNVNAIVSSGAFLKEFLAETVRTDAHVGPFTFVMSAGNLMPPTLITAFIDRFGPVLVNCYGSTENSLIAIATGEDLAKDPTTSGKPAHGVRLKIFREDGTEAATGEMGRVYSSQSMTMKGMLSARDTSEFIDGMLFSGDLGYLDERGYLYLGGRADSMVIRGGENVFPRAAQDLISTIDGVAEVYVKGIQNGLEAILEAYVVTDDTEAGAALHGDSAAIQEAVRATLADTNVPDEVIWLDHLPRNEAGKVVPQLLGKPAADE